MVPATLFAFTADLHLRPNAWAKRPSLRGDSYESLRQIVDYCLEQQCPLFLGGDIFDQRRPDPESVNQFCTQIGRMGGLPAYYVQGDHDYSALTTWPNLALSTQHLHGQLLELGPFKIYGLDWTPTALLEEAIAKIPPEANTLFTHLSWAEIQTIGQTQFSAANLPLNIATVMSGDYHVHLAQFIQRVPPPGVSVFSPGSTCMQAIDEPPHKQFWVCEQSAAGTCLMQPCLLRTRVAERYKLDTPEEFEKWISEMDIPRIQDRCDGLPEAIHMPIMRVQYNDAIPEAHDRINAVLGNAVHLFEGPYHTFVEQSVDMPADATSFDTLVGAVRELATDEVTTRDAIRLLESDDPQSEISVMQQEFTNAYRAATVPAAPAANADPCGDTQL